VRFPEITADLQHRGRSTDPAAAGAEVTPLELLKAEDLQMRRDNSLNGTDHRSHVEQNAVIETYIRWRNRRALPRTGLATDSPIRTWTHYPAKVA
jgi:hypothetical protein